MKRTGLVLAVIFAVLCAGAPCVMAAAVASKAVTVGGSRSYYYIFDEDAMGSNSAVGLPTQQSTKAYVDSKATTTSAADLIAATAAAAALDVTVTSVVEAYTDGVAVTIAAAATSDYTDVSPTATTMPVTTITDDTFTSGQAYRVTFAGNKDAGNGAASIALSIGGSTKSTLDIASATTGDFHGQWIIYNTTAASAQEISGFLKCAVAADGDADHVTDTTDYTGGNKALALVLTSGHASDTITVYYVLVEKLP